MLILISIIVATAAIFGWLSARGLKLPNTIGTMLLTVTASIGLILLAPLLPGAHLAAVKVVSQIDFESLILHGMLSLLLFAGAFLLDLRGLLQQKVAVSLLAVFATVLSVLIVGFSTFYIAGFFGLQSSLLECLLFGALISPTDPIAVLEMLRRVKSPQFIESQLAGESLFNDGVAAVIFLALLGATRGQAITFTHLVTQVLISAGGGLLLGAVLALPVALMMRSVSDPLIDILLSLALALGGYAIADHLGSSAPLETVAAALVLRLLTERQPEDVIAQHDLQRFWTYLDEIQNAILFVLLGCGFLVIAFARHAVFLGLSEIVVVNVARVASVSFVLLVLKFVQPRQQSSLAVLSWGGLRGGLSIALALSIPRNYGHGWITTATYLIVVFSILVQGSTMGLLLKRMPGRGNDPQADNA